MRILAVANQKGGVAKTTTAVNLAAEMARTGSRVLLLDFDPQQAATSAIFGNVEFEPSAYHLLCEGVPASKIIQTSEAFGIDVIPSDIMLSSADLRLASVMGRETALAKALRGLEYDLCIIDTPPTLGLLSINALVAADEVLIPICPEYFSLKGIVLLEGTIQSVWEKLDARVELLGVLVTRYQHRVITESALEAIRQHFGSMVFETIIPENIRIEEAHNAHLPVWKYDPDCKGAAAYKELASAVIRRQKNKKRSPM